MPEPQQRLIVDGVEFSQLFFFPKIFRAIPAALDPARLLIALLMVALLIAFGRLLHPAIQSHVSSSFAQVVAGSLSLNVVEVFNGVANLKFGTLTLMWQQQRWLIVLYGLIFLVVFTLGGGAIARMAASDFASRRRLSVREAMDFSFTHWGKLFWATLLPFLMIAALAAVIVLMGALMALPGLDVLGGILYGVVLVVGFMLAFVVVGYGLGFPLLLPAIACENCDGADAMQRAYAYVVSRPLHVLGYYLVAFLGWVVGLFVVSLFAMLALGLSAWLFSALTDNPALAATGGLDQLLGDSSNISTAADSWHVRWAATAIAFWQGLVLCLLAAYALSYFFSASAIVYLLIRRLCDGQDIHEIWSPGLMPGMQAAVPRPSSASASARPAPSPVTSSSATAEADNEGLD